MTDTKTNAATTTVQEVEMDLDNILGTPGGDNVMLPSDAEKKPTLFTQPSVDTSFLDNDDDDSSDKEKTPTPGALTKALDQIVNDDMGLEENEEDSSKATGRPKVAKDAMIELAKKLIEKGQLIPFDDDKPVEKYSTQDFEELFEANMQERERKLREQTPVEFFEALPEELQYAAKYVADGGADLKGLFRVLAQVEETKQLDTSSEDGQEIIVRSYLQATNFGNTEEIEEEIEQWKDRGDLESKANKFKPKLDAMQEQIVQRKLAQQEQLRKQQHVQANAYMENVYNVLAPGELNGLKVDKKVQSMLYTGLVQPNYPSVSGRNTNMLGHLLEKYQYVEPRHDLIAEALWLLADPDGYKEKVREVAVKETVAKTVRQLKTEQASKNSASIVDEQDEPRKPSTQKLQRAQGSFFKR
tara:strand:+ start:2268 stop:3509 length:1242 start_codon:yes stop_codon:yes gene_type:complete